MKIIPMERKTFQGTYLLHPTIHYDHFSSSRDRVLPERLDFHGRMISSHQNNGSDLVNLALNYGYGYLEGEVRKAINSVGLEPSVGFLHDFSKYQTKQSLVYDLQEPFR